MSCLRNALTALFQFFIIIKIYYLICYDITLSCYNDTWLYVMMNSLVREMTLHYVILIIYYVNLILVFPVWGFVSKKSTARATKRGGPSDEIAKKSPASHSVWETEQIPPPSSKTLSTKQRPKCCSFSPDILTLHMYVYKCIISERDAKQYRTDHYIPMIPHC